MNGFGSLFDCVAEWKRRLILFAFLAGVGGMLWETNDLIKENPDHPVISPEASIQNLKFDEFGEPVALAVKAKPLPVQNVWGSPLTQLCLAFILALVIGSLFRSLLKGSLTLIGVGLVVALLVGQESVLDFFKGQDTRSFFAPVTDWMVSHTDSAKQFIRSSLPLVCASVAGVVLGLMK